MTFDQDRHVQPLELQSLLLSFEGRTRRSHFWIGWLILLGAGVVLGWVPVFGQLLSIALIWPNTAIAVKRLHDMGQSGWLVLIPWVVGIGALFAGIVMTGVGVVATTWTDDPWALLAALGPAMGLFALSALVGFVFLAWSGLVDSQSGSNRFGPNPKGL